MESRKLRVGQPITPEQLEELTDEQLCAWCPKRIANSFREKTSARTATSTCTTVPPGVSSKAASSTIDCHEPGLGVPPAPRSQYRPVITPNASRSKLGGRCSLG